MQALTMPTTIFFSWQIDRPTKEGRNLVERALERAISRIGEDTEIEEAVRELVVDRDTKGVPGSPPIVDTIFRKIDQAAVFVPDLTFVGARPDGRPTPNPNVLIEYGWALKSLGYSRILPVMNTAFGKPTPDAMPFDMRHLRNPILYDCAEGASEEARKQAREILAKELERGIRGVLASADYRDTRPKPASPPEFQSHQPQEGPGKFRPAGEPLGVSEGLLGRGGHELRLSAGPVTWFRVMPTVDPGRTWLGAELRKAATEGGLIMPLLRGAGGYGFMRGPDGFGVYAADNPPDCTNGLVFLFSSGEVWAIDSYVLEATASGRVIPDIENFYRQALQEYSGVLVKLGIKPPFRWIAGMEGLKERGISPSGRMASFRGPIGTCLVDVVAGEGLYSPGDPVGKSLRPFFLKLFDSCGLDRPESLDA